MGGIARNKFRKNPLLGSNLGWSCGIVNAAPVEETLHTGEKRRKKTRQLAKLGSPTQKDIL